MDPQACLSRARDAWTEADFEECQEALDDYRQWRARGGFQPPSGDKLARRLQRQLDSVIIISHHQEQ